MHTLPVPPHPPLQKCVVRASPGAQHTTGNSKQNVCTTRLAKYFTIPIRSQPLCIEMYRFEFLFVPLRVTAVLHMLSTRSHAHI